MMIYFAVAILWITMGGFGYLISLYLDHRSDGILEICGYIATGPFFLAIVVAIMFYIRKEERESGIEINRVKRIVKIPISKSVLNFYSDEELYEIIRRQFELRGKMLP